MENNIQEEKVETVENKTEKSKTIDIYAVLPLLLSIVSICLMALGQFLGYIIDSYNAVRIMTGIFFFIAVACAITSIIILLVVKKQTKFDSTLLLVILSLIICFL